MPALVEGLGINEFVFVKSHKAQRVDIMSADLKKSFSRLGDPGMECGVTKTYLNICFFPP